MKSKKNEELKSRREFFKKATKSALPILGAVVLASTPLVSKASETAMGCYYSCSGDCSGSCHGGCMGCTGTCTGGCEGKCTRGCSYGCTGSCYSINSNIY